MDSFNQALARLAALVGPLNATQRLSLAGAAAAILFALAWSWNQQSTNPDIYLMGGEPFSASQLRDMESAFGKAGLTEAQIDGARVRVPQGQQARYMAALAEAGALPADFGEHLKKAVNASGFLLNGPRQEAQLKVAVQSELQLVISRLKGIDKAFVHIAEETSRGFPQTKTVTASVGVQPRADHALDEATVATIRSFVAGAWAGLKPEAVTVVDLNGNRLFAGNSGGMRPAPPDDYTDYRRRIESEWEAKITRMLGISGALVTPHVELDPDTHRPARLSVSVGVPLAHYEQIYRQQHSRLDGHAARPTNEVLSAIAAEERKRIEAALAPVVGGVDPAQPCIAVTTLFPPQTEIAPRPTPTDRTLGWLAIHWQAVGTVCLILVSLLLIRSAVYGGRPEPAIHPAHEQEFSETLSLVADEPRDSPPAPHWPEAPRAPRTTAENLRDELAGMVRQDPQAAASVLRTWIGNAS